MKHVLGKLLQLFITLVGVSFLTFSLTYLAPGDPALMVLEAGDTIVSQEIIEQTREEMGLNRPFLEQYGTWLFKAVQGDLGMSYSGKRPVIDRLMEGFWGTALLAATASLLQVLISVPLGILSAVRKGTWVDSVIRFFSFMGVSMPSFWVGLILLYVFAVKLDLFPVGASSVRLDALVLPAITLAVFASAKFIRQIRTVVLDELQQDYVTGARARGLSERTILWKHVLPNAMLPMITLWGLSLGWMLGGVAVIEIVFTWPGMGNMAVHSIGMRDYPLVLGFVLWVAIAYTAINFLVDTSYRYLDPRLRKGDAS